MYCGATVSGYEPVHFFSAPNAYIETWVAQVFTSAIGAADVVLGVSIESCKLNGPADMILEITPVLGSGAPDWNNPLGTATVLEPEIPAMADGCSTAAFEYVYTSYLGVNLVAGTQYVIVMKGKTYAGIRWQRSAYPTDPLNPYSGGDMWEYEVESGDVDFNDNSDLAFSVCAAAIQGCSDDTACNFDIAVEIEDGSCTYPGCNIPSACNYDPAAGCINESCEFDSCIGCTYSDAENYDPFALIDDGSCTYAASDCPLDVTEDGEVGTADLLLLLGGFGVDCP